MNSKEAETNSSEHKTFLEFWHFHQPFLLQNMCLWLPSNWSEWIKINQTQSGSHPSNCSWYLWWKWEGSEMNQIMDNRYLQLRGSLKINECTLFNKIRSSLSQTCGLPSFTSKVKKKAERAGRSLLDEILQTESTMMQTFGCRPPVTILKDKPTWGGGNGRVKEPKYTITIRVCAPKLSSFHGHGRWRVLYDQGVWGRLDDNDTSQWVLLCCQTDLCFHRLQ